jgi:hypothetical protein
MIDNRFGLVRYSNDLQMSAARTAEIVSESPPVQKNKVSEIHYLALFALF